ncbi:methylmalonyl Co-A mutase-associated GTPase MeaB [Aquihabitans sp. G128]|uniref:methylmalonyl Co-A mutase-associated GTPase MeaB n=1 Tax=Aquihabitans sp. G128 TaxID=2849779 RepID=UPI001C22D40A|nr:methylmalonyl Co-A mutase-associated GTPase MeaB [Aquihabitans sp. G128]QXC61408.1 methylmalonyl Co-A mutase-associated GTPase MeaB [Aquihabitans sp. G128]
MPGTDVQELIDAVGVGDRRALARAITLVESTRRDHRAEAAQLLDGVLARTGGAVRVGISGPPGVGKSTFIEALGAHLTGAGHRLAVLAVDPSSSRTGGSILGDKTRMETLARDAHAFIRPSPSGGELGGVARRTREAMLLCEAAGFDVVLVETVGVGQSELAVADLVDLFVLLASPSGGDDLQGIKRGIMELADLVVVTKADGDLANAARHAAADLQRAIHLLRPKYDGLATETLLVSSPKGEGIAEVWARVTSAHEHLAATGQLDRLRAGQARAWLWDELRAGLTERFREDPAVTPELASLEAAVATGEVAPTAAAQQLLDRFTRP